MTHVRNKALREQVLIRDLGLCRCCSFKAQEVHHVIPLVFNGKDDVNNMISLCHVCHHFAPDNKLEFFKYLCKGGARLKFILGIIFLEAEKTELETKGEIPFVVGISIGKQFIKSLREVDIINSQENYSFEQSLQVDDIDFTQEMKEWSLNYQK